MGPGPGGLTRALLLEGAARVVAVEKDQRCLPALAAVASAYPGRLEIIAADPAQSGSTPPRLFGLGDPAMRTLLAAGPRLVGWVARTVALDAAAGRLGHKAGEVRGMRRGDLEWRMANPPREETMDGLVPSLIEWQGEGAAALVGRDQELALLVERWRQAGTGEGQLVLLTGEEIA